MRKKKKERKFSPITIMLFITTIIAVLSFFGELFGIQGSQTEIVSGTLETSLIAVQNIISFNGIKYVLENFLMNFKMLEPVTLLIISFITLSVFEASGLASSIAIPLKKKPFPFITFMTLFISILSSVVGDYAYIFMIPLFAILYKHIGRNPVIGIITSFLGISIGYGTGFLLGYNDYALGLLTEAAAIIDIDKNFSYDLLSNYFIMIAATILLSAVGSVIIEKVLIPRIPKYKKPELEEYKISKKGSMLIGGLFIIVSLIVIYMLIPGLPYSGILLDNTQEEYVAKLFAPESPFVQSFAIVFMFIVLTLSLIYGKYTKNINSTYDFNKAVTKTFDKLSYPLVLLVFFTIMTTVLEYTNLNTVIAVNIIDFLSIMPISGFILILVLFVVTILLSIIIPGTLEKWQLMSPLVVPLLMRSNITPNFATFIYKAADGVGKTLSPIFVYLIIVIALIDKYDSREEEITIFGTIKMIYPAVLMFGLLWLIIILAWYIVGFPIGVGVYPTI